MTILEVLIVGGIVTILVAILTPALSLARTKGIEAKCSTNLRQVGVVLIAFITTNRDTPQPVVRDRNFYWDRGEQVGWDIVPGRAAGAAPESTDGGIWKCPSLNTSYAGSARALGLDNSYSSSSPTQTVWKVNTRLWKTPALLGLACDVQTNLMEPPFDFAEATAPALADLSDEGLHGWPNDSEEVTLPLLLDKFGPHYREGYGVVFGDGHSRVGLFYDAGDGVFWSGRRWWP